MNRRTLAWASLALVTAMAAAGFVLASGLPADARLPIHWDISGTPDRFADKWTALFLPPAIAGAVSLLFLFLPAMEPRRLGFSRSQGLYLWSWAALLVIMTAADLAVVATAAGSPLPVDRLMLAALAVGLLLIGNQLGKSRRMYMIGIRTPWTLASEEVWIKTHRLAGKLMTGGAAALLLACLAPMAGPWLAVLLGAVLILSFAVPLVYSFLLWRSERRGSSA